MRGETAGRQELINAAREATRRRDWPEAVCRWDRVRAQFPNFARAYFQAGSAMRAAGRADEAEALLAAAVIRFPNHEMIAVEHARVLASRRDWPAALLRWEAVRSRFPDRARAYVGAAEALSALGRPEEAAAVLDEGVTALAAARESGLAILPALREEIELATARQDWQTLRRAAEQLIAIEETPSAQAALALARGCWHLRDLDGAERAVQRALACQPTLAEAVLIGAWVAAEQGDGERTLLFSRTLARLRPENPRWPLQIVRTLNLLGRVKEAASELGSIVARWPDQPTVRAFSGVHTFGKLAQPEAARGSRTEAGGAPSFAERELAEFLDMTPRDAELRRPLAVDDPERDVIIAEAAGSETAVLVFTGLNDAMMMPLPIFDRYLAALGVTAVYLKDSSRMFFLRGIQSLAPDYAGTLAALRSILERLRVSQLCAIGNSAGGPAAIRYGTELDARYITCFSCTTHDLSEPVAQFRLGRKIMRKRFFANLPADMLDLKPFLQKRQRASTIRLYYGDGEEWDKKQALHLADVEGVALNPIADLDEHAVISWLFAKGELGKVLAAAVGLPPPATSG
jgi:tetratricopeptide (TPR) repeat protein